MKSVEGAQKQIRLLKRANQQKDLQLNKKQKMIDSLAKTSGFESVTVGKSGKRISTQSMFATGVRRNLSNIAATDFGATVLQDVSQQRVTRAEVRTCAALLARMKSTCSPVAFAPLPEVGAACELICDGPWRLSTVSFRSDATTSSIWRREKLHVLDVDFAWVANTAATRRYDAPNAIKCVPCLSFP